MEMTGQGCTHHVPHQSPGTRFPRRFGACFQLYFHAGWLPAVTGVGFFLSPRWLPILQPKVEKFFNPQSSATLHAPLFRPPGTEGREPAGLYPCPAHIFVQ